GWTGGPCGVGKRFPLATTRRLVHAALSGELDSVRFTPDPVFGVPVPTSYPDVPGQLLQPRGAWPDGRAYDKHASKLVELFRNNFESYETQVSAEVKSAGPRGTT